MEAQKIYEIFTDASFDDVAKVGTYAIVIMQDKKILKIIAKKCNVQLEFLLFSNELYKDFIFLKFVLSTIAS